MSATTFSNPVLKIPDAIRGTILVDRPEQIAPVLQVIAERVKAVGGRFETKNLFNDPNPLSMGYVGVHRRCWVPIPSNLPEMKSAPAPNQPEPHIIMEVQVHFNAILGKTKDCAKEFTHRVFYKRPKVAGEVDNSSEIIPSSQLVYLTAMKRVLATKEELDKVDNTVQTFQSMNQADQNMRLVMATAMLVHDYNLGRMEWNEKLKVVTPKEGNLVAATWMDTAHTINQMIQLPPDEGEGLAGCTNTATTAPELRADAKKIALFFQSMCQEAASSQQGCTTYYGPGDRCLLKTMESLQEKIQMDHEKEVKQFLQKLLSRIDRTWAQITRSGFSPFENIFLLQNLSFSNCHTLTNDDLRFVSSIPGLESLDLSGCTQLTDEALNHLADLTMLRSLNLSGCRFTDRGIGKLWRLTKLQSLNVHDCPGITDAGMARSGLQCLARSYSMNPNAGPAGLPARAGWIPLEEQLRRLNVPALPRDFGAAITHWYTALLRLAEIHPAILPQTIPPLPLDILQILNSKCPIYGDLPKRDGTFHTIGDTHVLSLCSQEFGSINTLEETMVKPYEAAHYQGETPLRSRIFWSAARREYGDLPFPTTYWRLTIRGVLQNSRGKTWDQLVELLRNLSIQAGALYEMPTLQESYAEFVMHHIATRGENVYFIPNQDMEGQEIYTYVKEPTGMHHMIIGGANESGVRVTRHYGQEDKTLTLGVMASRRL
jgi:hypothetical protein